MSWNDWNTKPTFCSAQAGPLVFAERAELHAVQPDAAGGRTVEPGEQSEERALAAAGGPEDGHERSVRHVERDTFQDGQLVPAGEKVLVRDSQRSMGQHH
jgi:hypothetical protein